MAQPLPKEAWGPPMWRTLHAIAYSSPPPGEFVAFVRGLASVIPCKSCKAEFVRLLNDGDADAGVVPLDDERFRTQDLLEWTVKLHGRISPPPPGSPVWTREMTVASLFRLTRDSNDADDTERKKMLIGPNALAMGLAVGIMVAIVAAGILGLIAYAVYVFLFPTTTS